jgi:hypothetical protein
MKPQWHIQSWCRLSYGRCPVTIPLNFQNDPSTYDNAAWVWHASAVDVCFSISQPCKYCLLDRLVVFLILLSWKGPNRWQFQAAKFRLRERLRSTSHPNFSNFPDDRCAKWRSALSCWRMCLFIWRLLRRARRRSGNPERSDLHLHFPFWEVNQPVYTPSIFQKTISIILATECVVLVFFLFRDPVWWHSKICRYVSWSKWWNQFPSRHDAQHDVISLWSRW